MEPIIGDGARPGPDSAGLIKESSTAAFGCHVGKAPHIAQPDRAARGGQYEARSRVE